MWTFLSLFLAITIFAQVSGFQDQKYCNKNLCEPGQKHIACGHSGKFDLSCPIDALVVQLNQKQKNLFVNHHNSKRNLISWGKHKGFPTASKMLTLQWDDELAMLASLNVMQCRMNHDQCRSTAKFKYAGQNLASRGNYPNYADLNTAITKTIDDWFDEIKQANKADIKQCCSKTKKIGHFTQVVSDRVNRVGCAVARYSKNIQGAIWKYTLIACN